MRLSSLDPATVGPGSPDRPRMPSGPAGALTCLMLLLGVLIAGCATSRDPGLDPRDPKKAAELNEELATRYYQQGNLQLARKKAQRALELDSSLEAASQIVAATYVEQARRDLNTGRLERALKAIESAKSAYAELPRTYLVEGLIDRRLGELNKAETALKRALELEGDFPEAHNAYGHVLCDQGRYQAADEQFRISAKSPDYEAEFAYYNAGLCARRIPDMDKAERHFRRALEANPEFPQALYEMARLSCDQSAPLRCRAYLERYAAVSPHTPETLWLGIEAERALGDLDAARNYALQLRSEFPDSEAAQKLEGLDLESGER